MNHNAVWEIIAEDLGMRKICTKMVHKLLSDDQKDRRKHVCQDIIERLEMDPDLLGRVITGDETWVFEYDSETKRQCLEWKSPGSLRPKSQAVQVEDEGDAYRFYVRGIIHME